MVAKGESEETSNEYQLTYQVGVAENKNAKFRKTMEDVHTYVKNFASRLDWGYFAVFDGHAGSQASKWCGSHLHTVVEKKLLADETRDVREVLNESFVSVEQWLHCCCMHIKMGATR